MFTNFLKVTIRNLYREKMYAVINIFGLSVAIACFIILGLYLRSELTYDRHNTKHEQIYRVVNEYNVNGKIEDSAITSYYLGPMLKEQYPEILDCVRFLTLPQSVMFRHGDDAYFWENHCVVDDNVFEVFDHEIIYGDPKTALLEQNTIAVSETFAKKYFGNANPVGETMKTENETETITLVFADLPENSHLKYDILSSIHSPLMDISDNVNLRRAALWMMMAIKNYTYLVMPKGYDIRDFENISSSFYERNMAEMGKMRNMSWRAWLQPLASIHLKSDVGSDLPTANRFYIYGFAATAIFILLVACINYTNLATARATRRAKEVGMRKILGSGRGKLMFQFLGESIVFSLIAMFVGVVLVELALYLTPINELLGKSLALDLGQEPLLLGWLLVFAIVIGLLSGIYPAFYLSSILPLSALVSSNRAGKGSIRIREFLVLIQFIISVCVISCTLLMTLQMRYLSNKSLGFNKENRLLVRVLGGDVIKKIPTFEKELSQNSHILGFTSSTIRMGSPPEIDTVYVSNNDGVLEETSLKIMEVGDNFLEVMGMTVVEGRDFSKKLLTDVGDSYIVNETLVNRMGWSEPLGKRVSLGINSGRVIGVVKDFHLGSLHNQIAPLVMQRFMLDASEVSDPYSQRFMVLNISGEEIRETIAFLQETFSKFDARHPLEYEFLGDALDKLYTSDEKLMKLIGIFAGICILISCLGLFGLAAFTTEQRTKEIGIRKILGASTWQIIAMLARNILLLVVIGAAVASLAAYYAIDEWLTGFAYHTGINPLVFPLSAAIAAAVAFITIALQSYKTARANPVKALRYE